MASLIVIFLFLFCIKFGVVSYRLNIGIAVEYQSKQSVEDDLSITDDILSVINQIEREKINADIFICLFSNKYNESSIMVLNPKNIRLLNYPIIFSTLMYAHLCPLEAFYDQREMRSYQGFLFLYNNLYQNKYNNIVVKQVLNRNSAVQESMMYIYLTPEVLTQHKATKSLTKANIFSDIYSFEETRLFIMNSLLHLGVSIDNDKLMEIDIISDKIQYNQLEINNRITTDESLEHSYIKSGSCNLWWPLNHTILYVHTLPLTAAYDKIEKIIFVCEPNIYNNNDARLVFFANITEIGFDNKNNKLFSKSEEIIIDGSKIRNKKPVSLPVMLALASNDPKNGYIDYISLDISICFRTILGNTNCIGNFKSIIMNVVEGIKSRGNFVYTHPMINQIENRDELGLALSFLLPSNASTFIEIGVQDGKYSENILHTWSALSRMILIDPWRSQNHETYVDIANTNNVHQTNSLNATLSKMSGYSAHVTILRMTSLEASVLFLNNSIDIVYIDALHHFKAVMQDINLWWNKVKPGGLIAGHDYLLDVIHDTIFTVKPAVDEFALLNNLTVFQTKDYEYPSWMIYKPIIDTN